MATNNSTNTSKPITVAQGGIGVSSLTSYAVICGGTTSTGNIQSIASAGTSNQLLTSNGPSALPTFQSPAGLGSSLVLIQSQTASASANLSFTTNTNLYNSYFFTYTGILPATVGASLRMQISANGGSNWITTSYLSGSILTLYNSATVSNANSVIDFLLSGTIHAANANETANGNGYIHNCNTANQPYVTGQCGYFDNGGNTAAISNYAGRGGATGANAFRFLMSSGNISQGIITLYGLRTS